MALTDRYTTRAAALANYDYTDLDEGVGYVVYYGAKTAAGNLLTKQTVYSNDIKTQIRADDQTVANKVIDDDYDVTFNLPKTIKGKLFCSVTQGVNTSTNTENGYVYIKIRARKWDGSSETELGDADTDEIYQTGDGSWDFTNSKTGLVEIDIAETHFKAGETFRLTVEVWARQQDATCDTMVGYGHDPKDRNDTYDATFNPIILIEDEDTTILETHVPFKLNL